MARRKAASKRVILPDPLFGSELIAKFINIVMCNGKKSIAEKIVYGGLGIIAEKNPMRKNEETSPITTERAKNNKNNIRTDANLRAIALDVFIKCLDLLRPTVEVRSRRVGGANYQVPVEVRHNRGIALAMRWLVEFAAARTEKTMVDRLANEIMDALNGCGGAAKKLEAVNKMVKANQAFAHFRW